MPKEHEINPELVQQFLDISVKEFHERYWGASQQYLDVMEILLLNDVPVIARIEKENDGRYAVYFSVKNERGFYYTHYFSANGEVRLDAVYLRVYSDKLTIKEILKYTTLIPFKIHDKGDLKGNKKNALAIYSNSILYYQPDENDAGNFEKKVLFLLERLHEKKEEIEQLKRIGCELYITAYWAAYISNTMLGGFYLNREIIKRLNELDIEVDFDLYVSGVSFK